MSNVVLADVVSDLQKSEFSANSEKLHNFLQSEQQYANWIQNRIAQYGFVENEDYIVEIVKTKTRGRPKKLYWVTLDMAKELAMVENNEKGKEARRYFIEVEKEFIKALNAPIKTSNVTIADVKRELTTARLRLTLEKKKHRQTAEYYENILKQLEKDNDDALKRIVTKQLDQMAHQLKTQFTQILENDIRMIQQAIDTSVIMMHKKITHASSVVKQLKG